MPSWPVYRYTSTLNSCNYVELSCISSFRSTFFSSECLGVAANHSGRVTAVIAVLCSMHHPLQGHMKRLCRTVWGSGCHAQRMSNDEVSSCSSFPKLHKICKKAFHTCTCVRRHNMDFWITSWSQLQSLSKLSFKKICSMIFAMLWKCMTDTQYICNS